MGESIWPDGQQSCLTNILSTNPESGGPWEKGHLGKSACWGVEETLSYICSARGLQVVDSQKGCSQQVLNMEKDEDLGKWFFFFRHCCKEQTTIPAPAVLFHSPLWKSGQTLSRKFSTISAAILYKCTHTHTHRHTDTHTASAQQRSHNIRENSIIQMTPT